MSDNRELIPKDLAEEYAELGVDKLIEESKQFVPALDNLGSGFPVVRTFLTVIKFPKNVSDILLGKKVYAFLYCSGLSQAKTEKFKRKFSNEKQERIWERVVFSINQHDDKVKSEIIGKLFNSLVDDFINEDEFFALVHATNSLNVHTLEQLKELYSLSYDYTLSGNQYYSFATLGLIDIDNSGIGTIGGGGPQYPLNQLGWKYVGIVFEFPPSKIEGHKIGEGVLIAELNDEGQKTGQAFPLDHIKAKGSRYMEIDIFAVTQDGLILCDSENNLPAIITSEVVPSGIDAKAIAQELVSDYPEPPLGILIRKMEDTKVQKWAFMVKTSNKDEDGVFKSNSEINEHLVNEPNKTDKTRYLVAVVEQVVRHTDGELKHLWA